ncbi:hypothetical protein SAMN05421890_4223 [Ensifer adhaerens]|nr:hypothetical protein SAMN05421890_4223 [Ensifer adhaerens]
MTIRRLFLKCFTYGKAQAGDNPANIRPLKAGLSSNPDRP